MGRIYQGAVGAFVAVAAVIGVLGGLTGASWAASVADPLLGGVMLGVMAFAIIREIPGR